MDGTMKIFYFVTIILFCSHHVTAQDSAILVLAGSVMFLVLQIIIAMILIIIGIRIYYSAKHTKNTTLAVIAEHVALPFSNNAPYEDMVPVEENVDAARNENVAYVTFKNV